MIYICCDQGVELGLGKNSVYAAVRNVNGYSEAKFRRDALLGIFVH